MPDPIDKEKVVEGLDQILESELAGIICYANYSWLARGFGRILIVAWLRQHAAESLVHKSRQPESRRCPARKRHDGSLSGTGASGPL
jgi:bacterioferritin